MKIVQVSIKDKEFMDGIVEMEKSTFGRFGGVDLWILKPIVKFGRVFAVVEKGVVIGAAEFMVAFDRPEAFLYGFSVMEKYREQGIGTNLLVHCEDYFKNFGIKEISLTVDPKNDKAITLYKNLDYYIESLEKDEYEPGIDRYIMRKKI